MAEQQPPPPDQRAEQVAAVLAGLAVAGGASAAAGAAVTSTAAVLAALTKLMLSWGWRRRAVRSTLRVATDVIRTLQVDVTVTGPPRPAYGRALADERTFAGWYLERVGTRFNDAVVAAETAGADVDAAVAEAEARERRWQDAHERAQQGRRDAADAVDAEGRKPGTLEVTTEGTGPRNADGGTPGDPDGILEQRPRKIVAWVTVNDDRATPECVAADGCWFYVDTPPIIGYPGQPHGATCRCTPGRATRAMFLHGRHVDEAVAPLLEPAHRRHPGAAPRTPRRRPRVA